MALLVKNLSAKNAKTTITCLLLTSVTIPVASSALISRCYSLPASFDIRQPFCRSITSLSVNDTICSNTLPQIQSTMAATQSLYHISGLEGLVLGRKIPQYTKANLNGPKQETTEDSSIWGFPPGTYTLKQVVEQVALLFESLLIQLGRDPPGSSSRTILLDGLRACLSLDARESTLPLGKGVNITGNSARKEIASQAQRISSLLVRYAQEVSPAGTVNPQLSTRSPCEGHMWTGEVQNILFGRRSNGNLMQVYNEWLHQLVLLRDGLLPFENFDEVPLIVLSDASGGMRPLENVRTQFLMQVMTAQVKRTTLLDVARGLRAPGLPSGGYGFQFARGIVMPASLLTGSSSILLRYLPAIVDDSQHQELLFDYENKDYYSVPREEIGLPAETVSRTSISSSAEDSSCVSNIVSSSLAIEMPTGAKSSSPVRYIKLCGIFKDNTQFSVDLGQTARGLRYAYRADSSNKDSSSSQGSSFGLHKAADVVSLPNLVTSTSNTDQSSLHVIQASSPVVRMALLGKLYPENIVLLDGKGQAVSTVLDAGKGFGPKFVIVGGEVK